MICKRQQGMTFLGWLIVLALLAFFTTLILRLFPLYNEAFKVSQSLKAVASQPDIARKDTAAIRKFVMRNFEVQDVDRFDRNSIKNVLKVHKIKGSKNRLITMKYEIRGPLLANLDVVLNYEDNIEIPGLQN